VSAYCCEQFAKQAGEAQAPVGGGFLYPAGTMPSAQFEPNTMEEGGWNVFGCCGGGCYIIIGMKFCPYCGTALK
jgi:hypothetical protein